MLTAPSASTPSWSSHTVARVAHAYGVSPATLVSRRRDPLLVEGRRVAMGLLAERGLGPCWIGKVPHRDHSTVLHHMVVLREGRSAEEQEMLSDLQVSIRSAPAPDPQGAESARSTARFLCTCSRACPPAHDERVPRAVGRCPLSRRERRRARCARHRLSVC